MLSMRLVSGGWMWDGGSFGVGLLHCRVRGHLHSEDPPLCCPWWFLNRTKKALHSHEAAVFVCGFLGTEIAQLLPEESSPRSPWPPAHLSFILFFKSLFFNKLFKFFCHFIPPPFKKGELAFWKQRKNYDQSQRKTFHFLWAPCRIVNKSLEAQETILNTLRID